MASVALSLAAAALEDPASMPALPSDSALTAAFCSATEWGLSSGAAACERMLRRRAISGLRTPHTRWCRLFGSEQRKNATAAAHLKYLLADAVSRTQRLLSDGVTRVLDVRVASGFGMRWQIAPTLQLRAYLDTALVDVDEQPLAPDLLARLPAALLEHTLAQWLADKDLVALGRTSHATLAALRNRPLRLWHTAFPLGQAAGSAQSPGVVYWSRTWPSKLPLDALSIFLLRNTPGAKLQSAWLELLESQSAKAGSGVIKGRPAAPSPWSIGVLDRVAIHPGDATRLPPWPQQIVGLAFLPLSVTAIRCTQFALRQFAPNRHHYNFGEPFVLDSAPPLTTLEFLSPETIVLTAANHCWWPAQLTRLQCGAGSHSGAHLAHAATLGYHEATELVFPQCAGLTTLELTTPMPTAIVAHPRAVIFPASLTSLTVHVDSVIEWRFPLGLRELVLPSLKRIRPEQHAPTEWIVPPRLERLVLGSAFNDELSGVVWPLSLTRLEFSADGSGQFDRPLVGALLPPSLQTLPFDKWNQSVQGVIWPATLRALSFGTKFNQSIDALVLPPTLESLEFTPAFDQEVHCCDLPQSLTALSLNGHWPQPDQSWAQTAAFSQIASLMHWRLPSKLTRIALPDPLRFNGSGRQAAQQHPRGAEYLEFVRALEASGVAVHLTSSTWPWDRNKSKAYQYPRPS